VKRVLTDHNAPDLLYGAVVAGSVLAISSAHAPSSGHVAFVTIVVTAIFSVAIYYWALQVALPTEEIEEMVTEVVLPEEEGLEMPTH
jgi:hypothetical protein